MYSLSLEVFIFYFFKFILQYWIMVDLIGFFEIYKKYSFVSNWKEISMSNIK